MENIQNIISTFAKANKISKVKLESLAHEIIQSLPKANKPERINSGKMGRPVLDKTKELHNVIIQTVNNGYNARRDAVLVRTLVGADKITFNNAVHALVKQGKIYQVGKASTGRKGRQPYILSTVKPEGV